MYTSHAAQQFVMPRMLFICSEGRRAWSLVGVTAEIVATNEVK